MMVVIRPNFDTGLPAYSDTLGTREKCHCNQVSLYPMIFSIRRSYFRPKNCHCNGIVTDPVITSDEIKSAGECTDAEIVTAIKGFHL